MTSKEFIENIVTEYNNCKKRKYQEEKSSKIEELNNKNEHFQIMVYIQKLKDSTSLLKSYEISFVQKTFNAVIFHFKSDCIYAVIKGSGWRLIQGYVDYDFPQKVAARILNKKGRISFRDKQLLGNTRNFEKFLKNEEPTNPFAFTVCTRFTAKLRPDASILNLTCFKNISNSSTSVLVKQSADVKVEIGLGSVRFKKAFEVEDFFEILDHLDKIQRGDQTFTTNGDNEEPSRAFYRYIQKVHPSKEEELNKFLIRKIQNFIKNADNADMSCLQGFDLCHKYIDKFSHGSKFTLLYQNKTIKEFQKAPSLESILINLITGQKCKGLIKLKKSKTIEIFRKELSNVKISFEYDEKIISAKLLDYIEGNILYNDQVYWRVMTKWCNLSEDYLKFVQKEFVDLLNKHLMKSNESGRLLKHWKENVSEYSYNKSYVSVDGYILGDRKLVKNIELFDLMFYHKDSNKTFLYHVKKGFNKETRIACSQVLNCANIIRNCMLGVPSETDIIKEYYEGHEKIWKKEKSFPNFISTYKDFKKTLEKPTLVYAVASNAKLSVQASQLPIEYYFTNCNKREESRSLQLEAKLKHKISANDIDDLLLKKKEIELYKKPTSSLCTTDESDDNCQISGKEIFDKLKQSNYIDLMDEVTSKLIYCSKKKFELPGFKSSENDMVFNLLSPYRTFFTSLGAKLEVLRTRNELEAHGFEFKIYEIPGCDESYLGLPDDLNENP